MVFRGQSKNELFPFYRRQGFLRDVPEDPVDAGNGGNDAVADAAEHRVGDLRHRGRNGVDGVDGSDDDSPAHIADSAAVDELDAGGPDVRYRAEILPRDLGKGAYLLADDRVRLAERLEPVARDGADAAHSEAGTGERLSEDHSVGQAERLADHADLVLVKELNGLDELELEIGRKASDVVVGLDALGLEYIGIYRPLGQEVDAAELAGLFGEDVDELLADDLALLLGIRDARQLVEEAVDGVDVDKVHRECLGEHPADLLGLALAEKAVVDVNADETAADGPVYERGADRRVHPARESQQDLASADAGPHRADLFLDESFGKFGGADAFH